MLITRISPAMARLTQVNLRYASTQSAFLQSVAGIGIQRPTSSIIPRESNSLMGTSVLQTTNLASCKAYCTKNEVKKEEPKKPEIQLPSKQELERYFFKITAIIWDFTWIVACWSWAMFRRHIVNNPTVQSYWKNFNAKLDAARAKKDSC